MGSLFNLILIQPILNILIAIYQAVFVLHIPYALGFSIIILTAVIRLILSPLTASQLRTSQKMQKITPHLNKLKEKHKSDAKMLQQETMRLYKEHGVNPAAGCVPLLIQFPIIIALYQVLNRVVNTKPSMLVSEINKVLYIPALRLHGTMDQNFFGLPLGNTPEHLIAKLGIAILLIPVITVLLQFIQSKMMFGGNADNRPAGSDSKPIAGKEKKKEDDFASAMQSQSLYILPLFIGFTSFKFPLGLSLYWNTFTIFGIIQQYRMQGWGGLQEWIDKIRSRKSNS